MHRFLTGVKEPPAKKFKTPEEKRETQRKYESSGRQRCFLPKWENEFKWLKNTDLGMTCLICQKYETTGTFITGNTSYKKDTILKHEKSDSHKTNERKSRAKADPSNTPMAKGFHILRSGF